MPAHIIGGLQGSQYLKFSLHRPVIIAGPLDPLASKVGAFLAQLSLSNHMLL